MTAPRTIVGIDLGTTYSLVGAMQAGVPTLLLNEVGGLLTPSAVAIDDDGSMLVGAAALARAATHPELAARWFKRDMGTARSWRLGERRFRAEQLSAAVLAHLKQSAEAVLGVPVEEAVVTVPAYFGDLQRQATRDAGEIAGLLVERIINEPTAAAIAYGLHALDRELRAVVLDLGGGTFDVTVLEIVEGVIEIQASSGDARLGGEDFVDALVNLVGSRLADDLGARPRATPRTTARVRDACERAKIRLSEMDATDVVLPRIELDDGREVDASVRLDRDTVEKAYRPVLARLRDPILAALRDARVEPAELDEILLVGGATRMPAVIDVFADAFGRMPSRVLPPDETVARGAVIQAALKSKDSAVEDLVVTDIAPFSLGVSSGVLSGAQVIDDLFSPIIERGTVIPASREQSFVPLRPGQAEVELGVFQGEHPMCKQNTLLGRLRVRLDPTASLDSQSILVRFTYDLNGILEVDATVAATGETRSLVIEHRPGAMRPAEIAAARAAMAKLKFHPRELLPNRIATGRASAAYARCTGASRELLQTAIIAFELALERQDPDEIQRAREQLNVFVAAIDRES